MHLRGMNLTLILNFCLLAVGAETASAQRGGYDQGGVNYSYGNSNHYSHSGYRHNSGYRPYHQGRYGYGPTNSGYPQNYGYSNYTRPYPYHLDYYRMRYGGSYEPYAGNIFGPPLVQQQFGPNFGVTPFVAPEVFPQRFATPFSPAPVRNYSGAYYW